LEPADHHIAVGGERRGLVGAGAPYLAPRHEPAEDRPALRVRPAVAHRDLRLAGERRGHLLVGARALLLLGGRSGGQRECDDRCGNGSGLHGLIAYQRRALHSTRMTTAITIRIRVTPDRPV